MQVSDQGAEVTTDMVQGWINESPFITNLQIGCTYLDAESGSVWLSMPMFSDVERGLGTRQFHGGAIASLIDTAGDIGVAVLVRYVVPTINVRIDYLRPAVGGYIVARAFSRRLGKTIAVADIDVHDESDNLVAVGRGCYGVVHR